MLCLNSFFYINDLLSSAFSNLLLLGFFYAITKINSNNIPTVIIVIIVSNGNFIQKCSYSWYDMYCICILFIFHILDLFMVITCIFLKLGHITTLYMISFLDSEGKIFYTRSRCKQYIIGIYLVKSWKPVEYICCVHKVHLSKKRGTA